ncbi:hypothetical protein evm_014144, partial [Chilo suppressalis]
MPPKPLPPGKPPDTKSARAAATAAPALPPAPMAPPPVRQPPSRQATSTPNPGSAAACRSATTELPRPCSAPVTAHPRDPRRRQLDEDDVIGGDEKRPRHGPSPPQPNPIPPATPGTSGTYVPPKRRQPASPSASEESDAESSSSEISYEGGIEGLYGPLPPHTDADYTASTAYFNINQPDESQGSQMQSYAQAASQPSPPRSPHTPPVNKQSDRGYPPIVVEKLPNWPTHFAEIKRLLGHTPNARPFKAGVRFTPKSDNEFRSIQRYLVAASEQNSEITWFCYAPQEDKPIKVAIRGIPADTNPQQITETLEERGFPVTYVRSIRGKRGRPGCIFHAQLDHMPREELARLYATDELLGMPGVIIEAWRPRAGPAQCHRCQAFGHNSANCHRPKKCLRCAGDHAAADFGTKDEPESSTSHPWRKQPAAVNETYPTYSPPERGSTRDPTRTNTGPTSKPSDSKECTRLIEKEKEKRKKEATSGRTAGSDSHPSHTLPLCPPYPVGFSPRGRPPVHPSYLSHIPPLEGRTPADGTSPSPPSSNNGCSTPASEAHRPTPTSNPYSTPSGPINQADPQTGVPTPPSTTNPAKDPARGYPRPASARTTTASPPTNTATPAHVDRGLHTESPHGGHRQGNRSHTGDNGSPDLAAPGGYQHKALRILYWNPGGIRKHIDELRLLSTEQDAHIILLGETLLSDKHKLKIPNFTTYRRDEATPDGTPFRGTAALVRRDLVHEELPWLPFKSTRTIGIRTKAGDKDLKVYAAYKPPQTQVQETDMDAIFCDDVPTILAGDLNCKHSAWGSLKTNHEGRKLLSLSESRNFEAVGPPDATHIPSDPLRSPDTIDIVLHKNISSPISVEVLYSTSTQHLPLLICLNLDPNVVPPSPPRFKTDWEAYTRELEEYKLPYPLTTKQEIDANINHLVQAMKDAKERHTSRTSTQRRDPLPLALKQKMAEKRRIKKLWATTRCPRTKTRLNQLTAEVATGVKQWRGDSWSATIDRATESKPGLYKLLRGLTKQAQPVCPLLDECDRSRYAALDRATIFANHLQAQFTPHPAAQEAADFHQNIEDEARAFLSAAHPQLPGDVFISPTEVRKIAIRLNPKKAPGPDSLPSTALAALPRRGVAAWTQIFNAALRAKYFPGAWKTGRVIMIPKPGKDRRRPGNYRPITLLDHVGKLFERLILRRLQPHYKPREEQYGFRSGHSTVLQLSRLLHHMAEAQNKGHCTVAVFLDVEKAFDRVWHPGLILKLSKSAVHPGLTMLIASYLESRSFRVTVEGVESPIHPVEAGVPQGSVLSPALYTIYTDDLPSINEDLQQWESRVNLALFADDCAFFTSAAWPKAAAMRMQKQLAKLPQWLKQWRVSVNVSKTAAICSTYKRPPPKLTLDGHQIEWASSTKYLGVTIDKNIRMVAHAEEAITKSRKARAALRPILTSNLPLRTKVQKKRIQKQQNAALRILTGAGRYVRNDVIARDLKIETVEEFVSRLARAMFSRADQGPYLHLQGLAPINSASSPGPGRHRRAPRPTPRSLFSRKIQVSLSIFRLLQLDGSLFIPLIGVDDAGLYECGVENETSFLDRINLTVRTEPPPLVNVTVHASTILALILWNVAGDGGHPIIDFTAEYRSAAPVNGSLEPWRPISPNHISPNS